MKNVRRTPAPSGGLRVRHGVISGLIMALFAVFALGERPAWADPRPNQALGVAAGASAKVSPQVLRANRLLRAIARAQPIGTMAVAPTYTQGAANANSTINTSAKAESAAASDFSTAGPTYKGSDSRFEYVSGHVSLDQWNGFGWVPDHETRKPTGTYQYLGSDGWGVRFGFDGQAFDILTFLNSNRTGSGSGGGFRVLVQDLATGTTMWTQAADYSGDANWRYYKIDFGSRARRIITIYFTGNAWFNGINVGPQDSVWKASVADTPRVAYFGDSYGDGAGSTSSLRGGLGYAIGDLLGVPNVIVSAVAGTGYTNAGSGVTWQSRATRDLATSLIGDMDLVVIFGTINDAAASEAAETAAVQTTISEVEAAQPNAIILVVGPQFVHSGQTTTTRYSTMVSAVSGMPGYGTRLFYTDNGPAGENWQTGTGYSGATTGVGNGDFYVWTDGTHPNDTAGEGYLASRIVATLIPILKAIVANGAGLSAANDNAPMIGARIVNWTFAA